jgi:hypothetical protein
MNVDPSGLQTTPELCLKPENVEACAEAGEITQPQAQAMRYQKVAQEIAKFLAKASCKSDDIDCEEWLELLNDEYLLITVLEKGGQPVEDKKATYNQMVDTFCMHCTEECSRAKRFEKRIVH